LEIGTSYGASAIAVALAKKAAGIPGKVYCVDPYKESRGYVTQNPGLVPAKISQARRNIKKAEVDVEIIRAKSHPFPKKLKNHKFVSAYIDGDHTAEWPKWDIAECQKRVEHFIGIDNYEEGYPDVMDAVHEAVQDSDWNIYFKNFLFIALRPFRHPRNSLLSHRLEHL
jgi:predicted O-methyltransferase YrrM